MTLPSLIATDLDGTLLDSTGHIPPLNVEALRRAHEMGIPILVSTGRPLRWLTVIDELRPFEPHVICSNGAVRLDLASGLVEERHVLPVAVAKAVVADLRAAHPPVHFGVEYGETWGHEPGFPLREDGIVAEHIAPIDELLDLQAVKLLVVCESTDTETLARLLLPVVGGRLEATWSFMSRRGLLEICAPEVSKAASLLALCDELGVDPVDAVAFGDMPNDVSMLRAVGHPYLMTNGHPSLRELGFGIAGANDDPGVGLTVLRLLDQLT